MLVSKISPLLIFFTLVSLVACREAKLPDAGSAPPQSVSQQTALQPDAVFVVNGADATLSVLDAPGTQVLTGIKLPSGSFPHHAYLSPDGQTLAVSLPGMDFSGGHGDSGHGGMSMPGRFALIDTRSGQTKVVKNTPAMHHNAIFSPDGREIWAAAMEPKGRVLVYDAVSLNLLKEIPVGAQPAEVTFSADGKRAFVANGGSNSVTVIDRLSKQIAGTVPVGHNPVGAWPGSDNRLYIDNEESKSLSVIQAESLQIEQTVALGFMPGMATLHPTQNQLWVSDAENGKVVIFTRAQANGALARSREIVTGAGAHAIAFSKDGQTAFVTNQGAGTVSILDVSTGSKRRDLKVGAKPNGLAIR